MPLLFTNRCGGGPRPVEATPLLSTHGWLLPSGVLIMVARDAPNIKDCIILGLGSAILFFSHHQEPQEGLYLHEAQELAKEMMRTTTWIGQPMHQQVFPITIVEG